MRTPGGRRVAGAGPIRIAGPAGVVSIPLGALTGLEVRTWGELAVVGAALAGFGGLSGWRVTIGGEDPRGWRQRHRLGYLPSSLPEPWPVRVGDLLALRTLGGSGGVAVDEVVAMLGLERLVPRPADRLTLGEWKAVMLAFAGLGPPDLLVLEEPWTALPGRPLARLPTFLRGCRRGGATVVVVGRDRARLAGVCDAVTLLSSDDPPLPPPWAAERAPAV